MVLVSACRAQKCVGVAEQPIGSHYAAVKGGIHDAMLGRFYFKQITCGHSGVKAGFSQAAINDDMRSTY